MFVHRQEEKLVRIRASPRRRQCPGRPGPDYKWAFFCYLLDRLMFTYYFVSFSAKWSRGLSAGTMVTDSPAPRAAPAFLSAPKTNTIWPMDRFYARVLLITCVTPHVPFIILCFWIAIIGMCTSIICKAIFIMFSRCLMTSYDRDTY